MTYDEFLKLPPMKIFAKGTTTNDAAGVNMSNSGNELMWVAVKGSIDDWTIYISGGQRTYEQVRLFGDKVRRKENILKLVPCDEEMLKAYRY